jgi:GntR family transcriptional repressor for pyruvate dehydrogenase complex
VTAGSPAVPGRAPGRAADEVLIDTVLQPVRDHMAFESCVEQLGSAIQLGVLRPGSKLPAERELAARMNISRSTVREAISALRAAGMVSTTRGRGGGTLVEPGAPRAGAKASAAPQDLEDLLVFRRIVEPGACETAAGKHLTRAHRDLLRSALEDSAAADEPESYRQADARLHLAIASVCGSAELSKAVSWVQIRVHQYLSEIPFLAANITHSDREHGRMVRAIIAGDPITARTTMERHCDATAALLKGLH